MRFFGNARHHFGCVRALRSIDGRKVAVGVYAEEQPQITKLIDNHTRKMVVQLGDRFEVGPVAVELVIPDAQAFLDDVWACAKWVEHGDVDPSEGKR